jgi:hypothetical protein
VLVNLPAQALSAIADPFAPVDIGVGFQPLTQTRHLPVGSEVDTRKGTVKLLARLKARGRSSSAILTGAIVKISQSGKGPMTVTVLEGAFSSAPSYKECKSRKSTKVLQTLLVSSHGTLVTRTAESKATGMNATWSVADRCDGTLVKALKGAVTLSGPNHKTTTLRAG